MQSNWKFIALYFLVALGLSYPIQNGYMEPFFGSVVKGTILHGSGYLLAGISTFAAAIIAMAFHKNLSSSITILGKDKLKNALIGALPIMAFTIIGLENKLNFHASAYGFLYVMINTIYAFAEEFGWRRYLQNALENLNPHVKYLLIGLVWWIWHFRFTTQFDLFIFPLICLGGGYLLGKLTDEYKSILPATAMHTLIIITTNSGTFSVHEILGILFVLIGWIVIEQFWKKKELVKP